MENFMRISKCLWVASAMAAMVAFAHAAHADQTVYSGNECVPIVSDTNKVDHTPTFGVDNISFSTAAVVQCPIRVPYSAVLNVTSAFVVAYDRSTVANVNCVLLGLDFAGNVVWSDVVNTTGGGPGTGLQFMVFPTRNRTGAIQVNMQCVLPAAEGNAFSHIEMYEVTLTP
jgi:hypothetical protein